ncbi:CAP domain-containing protein [Teichococcus oryzae]|uniref:CAP domain-containing protein n=1 Tax=Teichococcus oryzae TaxID=1608942 RepID=A0A5B2TE97_9PROT|nr:CAP domain-containing protein [Pseudoroseomonas oryzae]KAA2212365.1 CAP domain-containing protein [Pseudoroseomonas oryzae]
MPNELPTSLESYFLGLINDSRSKAGVKPLSFDGELLYSAGQHSDWMVAKDVFSHTGANGSSAGDRMKAAGYGATAWGENIAYIGGSRAATLDESDVQQLHTNLMNSSGHRANLLNPNFTEVGIGLTQGDYKGRPAIFVTENFGRPNASEAAEPDSLGAVVPSPVPTPAPTPAPAPAPAPTPVESHAGVTALETYFLKLVNASRADAGLKPFSFDAELVEAAGQHSEWMVAQDVFSHRGANGSSPSERVTDAGYGWTATGENIAYIGGSRAATLDEADVEQLHANLMNSSGHRANILSSKFTEIGIGLEQGDYNGRPAIFVTENFGRPNASEALETDGWFI